MPYVVVLRTEKSYEEDHPANTYVRWFPLTDPKWTDSVGADIRDVQNSHRSTVTEEKNSSSFKKTIPHASNYP